MRALGVILIAAGAVGAVAVPLLGFPAALIALMGAAAVVWFVGIAAAATCLAPARPLQGGAAATAAVLGWPMVLVYGLAPLWGLAVVVCGVLVSGALTARWPSSRRVSHTVHPDRDPIR